MTERDFQILEMQALKGCLEDDGFNPEEIAEILSRVEAGEDVEDVMPDFRENY